jgi:hypothetical protein
LGFANYYRIFIKDFSQVAAPLTRLIGKDKFQWNEEAEATFEALKTLFVSAPILHHIDFSKAFFMEIDESDFALGAVLLQMGTNDKLHPIAFHSRKFSTAEINYEIHDKEILEIVDSFQEWRHYLEGASSPIIVYTDHKNLEYFMSTRVLNRRQARWSMSLSRFEFIITYRPGKQQGLSDALSRRSYFAPKEGDIAFEQQRTVLLKPEQFHLRAMKSTLTIDLTFVKQIQSSMSSDPLVFDVKSNSSKSHDSSKFEFKNNLLYFEGRLYVPEGEARLRVFQARHDFPAAGHFGYNKTYIKGFLVAKNVEVSQRLCSIM